MPSVNEVADLLSEAFEPSITLELCHCACSEASAVFPLIPFLLVSV